MRARKARKIWARTRTSKSESGAPSSRRAARAVEVGTTPTSKQAARQEWAGPLRTTTCSKVSQSTNTPAFGMGRSARRQIFQSELRCRPASAASASTDAGRSAAARAPTMSARTSGSRCDTRDTMVASRRSGSVRTARASGTDGSRSSRASRHSSTTPRPTGGAPGAPTTISGSHGWRRRASARTPRPAAVAATSAPSRKPLAEGRCCSERPRARSGRMWVCAGMAA